MLNGHSVHRDGTQCWYLDDQLHRTDGPAVIRANGTKEWWVNSRLHRLDGPAWIDVGGTQFWYVKGQDITEPVLSWMKHRAVSWPWDDQTQMLFLLTWG